MTYPNEANPIIFLPYKLRLFTIVQIKLYFPWRIKKMKRRNDTECRALLPLRVRWVVCNPSDGNIWGWEAALVWHMGQLTTQCHHPGWCPMSDLLHMSRNVPKTSLWPERMREVIVTQLQSTVAAFVQALAQFSLLGFQSIFPLI